MYKGAYGFSGRQQEAIIDDHPKLCVLDISWMTYVTKMKEANFFYKSSVLS